MKKVVGWLLIGGLIGYFLALTEFYLIQVVWMENPVAKCQELVYDPPTPTRRFTVVFADGAGTVCSECPKVSDPSGRRECKE